MANGGLAQPAAAAAGNGISTTAAGPSADPLALTVALSFNKSAHNITWRKNCSEFTFSEITP